MKCASVVLLALVACACAQTDMKLPALAADMDTVTVSGISAGAFMSVQLHVAHSALFKGAGVVAGGPFYCAQGNLMTATTSCMADPSLINLSALYSETLFAQTTLTIDSTGNLADDRVYIFSGTNDTVVRQGVGKALLAYYSHYLEDPSQIKAVFDVAAEHSMVTSDFGSPCGALQSPYINKCGVDVAGDILKHLYGDGLNPPVAPVEESHMTYSQESYVPGAPLAQAVEFSMGQGVFSYIPRRCMEDASIRCRVHVALHGCQQNLAAIGEKYVRNAGYNGWAESNNIIVLYPQVVPSDLNPKACWDWWGYLGVDYAVKEAPQISTIVAMVKALGARRE